MSNLGVEAFWIVEFEVVHTQWAGAGVVVLETNRVYGGDGHYYYKGSYQTQNGIFT